MHLLRPAACHLAKLQRSVGHLGVFSSSSIYSFFHFLLLLSPPSWAVAPDLISGAINVELCPVVFTITLHMFL